MFTVTSIRRLLINLGKTLSPQILENLIAYIVRQTPDEKLSKAIAKFTFETFTYFLDLLKEQKT